MSRGIVVWFTGLPASGKSTLAQRVRARLAPRIPCIVLDSDEIRAVLGAGSYTAGDRDAFYRSLAELAGLLARQGHVVLVAATAPRRAYRDHARAQAPTFVEVWVRTPLAACEARDPKGLYRQARDGEAPRLPGIGEPYEPPRSPAVIAADGRDDQAAAEIARLVTEAATVARDLQHPEP